jgi:hypothetical protein
MERAGANEPEGLERAPEDWWIEDRVTDRLREAKPKARSLQLTDDEARDYLERFVFHGR